MQKETKRKRNLGIITYSWSRLLHATTCDYCFHSDDSYLKGLCNPFDQDSI